MPIAVWGVIVIPASSLVVWMGALFGRQGALVTSSLLVAIAVGFTLVLLAAGPGLQILYVFLFAPPFILSALIGVAIWFFLQGASPPPPR
jgi:hypothetical protein